MPISTLRVAAVQFSPIFGDVAGNMTRLDHLLGSAKAHLIVLPELCLTGYNFVDQQEALSYAEPPDGASVKFFRSLALHHSAVVVAGFAERGNNSQVYNSCCVIVPESSDVTIYRKTHLFYREQFCFSPGDTGFLTVHDSKRDFTLGAMICYDWRFPEAARTLALAGAEVIVCPSNLVTDLWQKVMPARAIENKVYFICANRAGEENRGGENLRFKGKSAIYGWDGEPLAQAADTGDCVISAAIFPDSVRDKSFNAYNDIFRDRRPEMYGGAGKL